MANLESDTEAVASDVALYATQGGGFAEFVDNTFVWHSDIPEFLVEDGVAIGDVIPQEWGVVPINERAIEQSKHDDPLTEHSGFGD
jgi:hypothetical protein